MLIRHRIANALGHLFGGYARATRYADPEATQQMHDGYRNVVIETAEEGPSPTEADLRQVIEDAIQRSDIADVLAADSGAGTISLWIRLKKRPSPSEPESKDS